MMTSERVEVCGVAIFLLSELFEAHQKHSSATATSETDCFSKTPPRVRH